jgi:hypothetical protein
MATQRGRKSAASLAVSPSGGVSATKRLAAPVHLNTAEMLVWQQLVNDQPAAAFTQTHIPALELYCRHVVQSRVIAEQIQAFEPAWLSTDDGLSRYDALLKMQERESRAITAVARSLRVTRQSIDNTVAARMIKNQPTARKPWETAPAGDVDDDV